MKLSEKAKKILADDYTEEEIAQISDIKVLPIDEFKK